MRAWLFQDSRQKSKLGDKCPWSVNWIDPDGKRKSKSIGSKSMAEKYARKMEGQLAAGLYQGHTRKPWADFRAEYKEKILPMLASGTQEAVLQSLDAFQGIASPAVVAAIKTATIDAFIAKRQLDEGRRPGSKISPATINKELRHLKAVLRVAHDWRYLPEVPKFRMLKEPQKLARFISPEDFGKIYDAADAARFPESMPFTPGDWWRGLFTFAYMTGWRVGQCLEVRRADVDLEAGTAVTRAASNKGKRDEPIALHPVVIEHLRKLTSFYPLLFPWTSGRRMLYEEFHRIQTAAKIHLDCHEPHESHTEACHLYGFHDLRRGFATMNAGTLPAETLQRLMQHQSYTTTQKYINMAKQANASVPNLYVPAALNRKQA
jgi:integrase